MRSTIPRPWVLMMGAAMFFANGCKDDDNKGWPDGWVVEDGGLKLDIKYPDLGGIPDGLPYDPEGPKIEIQKPKAGETILGDVMTVEAKITDPTTVNPNAIELYFRANTVDGQQVEKSAKMTSKAAVVDVYEAKIDVSDYVDIVLWIVAEDQDNHKNTSKELRVERDPGPRILFLLPVDKSSHKGSVGVQINVTDKRNITSFRLLVGSVDITSKLTNQSKDPKLQQWNGTLKFDDPLFAPPLSGKQVLTAKAENANKATSTVARTFIVDDQGPTITIGSQSPGDLVGGVIKLSATIVDTAGVIESSVKAVIGNNLDKRTVQLYPAAVGSTTYEAQFDTRTLTQSDLWPVMSFRAADLLGNESHEDIQVGLDNGQPILALDPPEDYHVAKKDAQDLVCSLPFDPTGPLAASDKQKVPQVQYIRARIEDRGNGSTVPSAPWVPISKVDPSTVQLYILDDSSQALVVDSDGDGYCDDINPNVIPTGTTPKKSDAVAVNLAPIPAGGKADFRPGPGSAPVGKWGEDEDPPEALCLTVQASIAIEYTQPSEPSIYTIPPIVGGNNSPECMGLPFDFGANMFDDGWTCAAATAKDQLGNRGISKPIRMWVDKKWAVPTMGFTPAPGTAGPPPDCTGTLKKDGTVDISKPCIFKDRRKASGCDRKCASCTPGPACPMMEFPQTFCHCEVWLQN